MKFILLLLVGSSGVADADSVRARRAECHSGTVEGSGKQLFIVTHS